MNGIQYLRAVFTSVISCSLTKQYHIHQCLLEAEAGQPFKCAVQFFVERAPACDKQSG